MKAIVESIDKTVITTTNSAKVNAFLFMFFGKKVSYFTPGNKDLKLSLCPGL